MKKASGQKTSWKLETWQERCAWCSRKIERDEPVFGIELRLRPEAFKEMSAGSVQPLLLFKAGKTVPMIIVTDDSPAKHEGKDALFQACSDVCAKALQAALKEELEEGMS